MMVSGKFGSLSAFLFLVSNCGASLTVSICCLHCATCHVRLGVISEIAFPTGRDSATFRDKGTEIPCLSQDKGTTGQAQNLATGRGGILTACPVPSWNVPRDRNERKSVKKMGFFSDFSSSSCLEHTFSVLERPFPVLELPFLF